MTTTTLSLSGACVAYYFLYVLCVSTQAIWHAAAVEDGVQLSLTSPDGDQGYPGEIQITVSYTLQVNMSGLFLPDRKHVFLFVNRSLFVAGMI